MKYVKIVHNQRGTRIDTREYEDYLRLNEERLPIGARRLFFPLTRFDRISLEEFRHDATIDLIEVRELAPANEPLRHLSIRIRLILRSSASLLLTYDRPTRYAIRKRHVSGSTRCAGHGSVIFDEIRMSNGSGIIHEIALHDATILVEAMDISVDVLSSGTP